MRDSLARFMEHGHQLVAARSESLEERLQEAEEAQYAAEEAQEEADFEQDLLWRVEGWLKDLQNFQAISLYRALTVQELDFADEALASLSAYSDAICGLAPDIMRGLREAHRYQELLDL